MNFAKRYVCGFIRPKNTYVLAARHARRSLYHHPMFRAFGVALKRQAGPGFHHQPLYFKALSLIDFLRISPRPINTSVLSGFSAASLRKQRHCVFHFSGVRLRDDQGCVRCGNDDHLFDSGDDEQTTVLAANIAVRHIVQLNIANRDITAIVPLRGLPKRPPAADVAPSHFRRYYGGAIRALHHGVVDRVSFGTSESLGVEAEKIKIGPRRLDRFGTRGDGPRLKPVELCQIIRRLEDEHTAVPAIASIRKIALRRRYIGLLHECGNLKAPDCTAQRVASTNIAITGFRLGRRDTKRNDFA